jgi:hypothetical protein
MYRFLRSALDPFIAWNGMLTPCDGRFRFSD